MSQRTRRTPDKLGFPIVARAGVVDGKILMVERGQQTFAPEKRTTLLAQDVVR